MGELKWRTPPPRVPQINVEKNIPDWASRLIQWLDRQEREKDYDVESIIALGGAGVAERLLGFEVLLTGYSPTHTADILAAPAAGKKRIITSFHIHMAAADAVGTVQKDINGTNYIIGEFDTSGAPGNQDPDLTGGGSGVTVLDGVLEKLEITITAGTSDISITGAYLEVD